MRRLRLSPAAEADLRRIEDYIVLHSPAAALAIVDRITDRCGSLVDFPDQGRLTPNGQRVLVITGTPYLAFYRLSRNSIDVLHIRHGRQRPQH